MPEFLGEVIVIVEENMWATSSNLELLKKFENYFLSLFGEINRIGS